VPSLSVATRAFDPGTNFILGGLQAGACLDPRTTFGECSAYFLSHATCQFNNQNCLLADNDLRVARAEKSGTK